MKQRKACCRVKGPSYHPSLPKIVAGDGGGGGGEEASTSVVLKLMIQLEQRRKGAGSSRDPAQHTELDHADLDAPSHKAAV